MNDEFQEKLSKAVDQFNSLSQNGDDFWNWFEVRGMPSKDIVMVCQTAAASMRQITRIDSHEKVFLMGLMIGWELHAEALI